MFDFTGCVLYTSGPIALLPMLPGCLQHPSGHTPSARSPPGPDQGTSSRFGHTLCRAPAGGRVASFPFVCVAS